MTVRKRKQKGFRISSFALLLVVFKRHYSNEGVKNEAKVVFKKIGGLWSTVRPFRNMNKGQI